MKWLMRLSPGRRCTPNLRASDLDDTLLADIGLSRNGDRLGRIPVEEAIETAKRPELIVIVNTRTMSSLRPVYEQPERPVCKFAAVTGQSHEGAAKGGAVLEDS